MGFGLLFVAYATTLAFRAIPIEAVGFFLAYLGAEKLSVHDKKFNAVKYASVFMFFESVLWAVLWFLQITKMPLGFITSETFAQIESILHHSGMAVFLITVYRAVASISATVGYEKGIKRSRLAFGATVIMYAAQIIVPLVPGITAVAALPVAVFQLVWTFINLFLLYGCYAMIVTDEMVEKEERKYNEYLEKHRPKSKAPAAENKKQSGTQKFKATKK